MNIRRGRSIVLVGTITALTVSLLSAPAQAEPSLAAAKAKAATLATKVAALQVRTEMATENFNAVNDELQRVVTRMTLAEQALDAARSTADVRDDVAGQRVRSLYMSGGSVALYASVLDGGDIGDVLSRMDNVRQVVSGDRVASATSWRLVNNATKARTSLGALAARRTVLQAKADRARRIVLTLLSTTEQQLNDANTKVRRLAQEYAEQQAAQAAESARIRLAGLGALGAAPPGNPSAVDAINAARSRIGSPYVWGATGPGTFDCSGLTQWAYAQAGVRIDRTSRQQWFNGARVGLADLRPGDLIFWAYDLTNPSSIHHVALYIGAGRMIEAPRTGLNVREIPVYLDGFIGAVRPGLPARVTG